MGWFRVALALVLLCHVEVCIYAFTVSTSVGEIVGYEDTWNNVTVRTFLGIPYAEGPIDDLRFSAPVPKAPFTSTFEAKKFGSPCIQNVEGLAAYGTSNVSEDCLSLNIYVSKGGEAKKAVMVWIHGGGYTAGVGEFYDGKMMAAASDVIVVTLNYRLGVFGFFTTGDASASGNYGLLDQQLALKWVQQNIGAFGGDESRVTIFGESAGGGSVSWLMLAPSNQGLFKRVIAQSGVASAPWGFPNPKTTSAYTKNLARALGCDSSDSNEIVSCLRKLPSSAFGQETADQWPYATPDISGTPAGPRVDGKFIPISPACRDHGHRIEELPLFRSVDLLAGANKFESEPFFTGMMMAISQNASDRVPKTIFEISATAFVGMEDTGAVETLWGRYAMGQAQMPNGKELLEFTGDAMFYKHIMDITNRHANSSTGSTYFYSFLPKPSNVVGSLSLGDGFSTSVFADGSIHADDLGFLFGNTSMWMGDGSAPGEKDLSVAMITYWTNFAKSGNPNSPSAVPLQWPEYKTVEKTFIELDIQNSTLDLRTNTDYRGKYMGYWSDIEPELQSYCITAGASSVRCGLSLLTIVALVSVVFGLFRQG